jgi:hypothetical protein
MRGAIPRRIRNVAAATIPALFACGDGAPSEPPATLEGLAFSTLFEIGAAEGEAWEAFGGIWDVEVAPDYRLAVLDLEAPAVHVFDASGAHIGSVEATGLDEGALDRPSGIAWSGAGQLLVWDPGSSWIQRFTVSGTGVEFATRFRAFAFGETGFCSNGTRTYLSYWQDGQIVHEIGAEGPVRSFAAAPDIPGVETLGPELQEIAVEELTPSALLCTSSGVLDVSFFGSQIRLHGWDGEPRWERDLDDFNPLVAYTPDGMGLGRRFDQTEGAHLLRSVVPWGAGAALVQHELRTQEFPEAGEREVIESRLIRLEDGTEISRSRDLPLILGAYGTRLYSVRTSPHPQVVALEVLEQG